MSETRSNQLGWSSKIHDCVKIKHCKMTRMVWYLSTYKNIKKQRHYFVDKGLYSQSYGFSIGHVWMWELDCEEGWVPKNWCIRTVVLEKTLGSPLDCKEIQPLSPKENQPWMFIGRTDVEAKYFGHLMRRADSLERLWCWERLKAIGKGGSRG